MRNVRKTTNRILEWVREGILDRDVVILACLNYMSEADVTEMAELNEFGLFEEEEDAL